MLPDHVTAELLDRFGFIKTGKTLFHYFSHITMFVFVIKLGHTFFLKESDIWVQRFLWHSNTKNLESPRTLTFSRLHGPVFEFLLISETKKKCVRH